MDAPLRAVRDVVDAATPVGRLRVDAVAGLTVAALALPASMAYAELAGLPVTLACTRCCCRSWPTRCSDRASGRSWARKVRSRCWWRARWRRWRRGIGAVRRRWRPRWRSLVGASSWSARLLRLGWIADYFSQSVLVGYITGVAILMILGQLGKLTGLSSDVDNAVRATVDIVATSGTRTRRRWSSAVARWPS